MNLLTTRLKQSLTNTRRPISGESWSTSTCVRSISVQTVSVFVTRVWDLTLIDICQDKKQNTIYLPSVYEDQLTSIQKFAPPASLECPSNPYKSGANVLKMAAVSSTRKNMANKNIIEPEVKSTFFHESKIRRKNFQCLERSAWKSVTSRINLSWLLWLLWEIWKL